MSAWARLAEILKSADAVAVHSAVNCMHNVLDLRSWDSTLEETPLAVTWPSHGATAPAKRPAVTFAAHAEGSRLESWGGDASELPICPGDAETRPKMKGSSQAAPCHSVSAISVGEQK